MTHVGEKLTLGPIGTFRHFFGSLQFALGMLALGDFCM